MMRERRRLPARRRDVSREDTVSISYIFCKKNFYQKCTCLFVCFIRSSHHSDSIYAAQLCKTDSTCVGLRLDTSLRLEALLCCGLKDRLIIRKGWFFFLGVGERREGRADHLGLVSLLDG